MALVNINERHTEIWWVKQTPEWLQPYFCAMRGESYRPHLVRMAEGLDPNSGMETVRKRKEVYALLAMLGMNGQKYWPSYGSYFDIQLFLEDWNERGGK